MRKTWLFLFVLAALLLSACGAAAAPAATAAPTDAPTAAPTSQPTPPDAAAPTAPAVAAPVVDCTPVQSIFSMPADQQPKIPPITGEDWTVGPEGARLQLIEYSDYQCPYCHLFAPVLAQFQKSYPADVRIAYRDFPLSIHDKSLLAAQAAEAAGLQGKYWEMHELLLDSEKWPVWTAKTPADFETWVKDEAKSIQGLDAAKFAADLTGEAIVAKVKAAYDSAVALSEDPANYLQGTPALYAVINGVMYPLSSNPTLLNSLLDLMDLDKTRFSACPPLQIDPAKHYTATLKTEKGDIVIELFADKAPLAVNSFIFLAKNNWFDNMTFFNVIAGTVAQTGDPSNSGGGDPGYGLKNEVNPELKFDKEGVVGMVLNSSTNTNGSQFFITFGPMPQLDGVYTIIGQVVKGLDIAKQLTPRDTSTGEILPPGDVILDVIIEEK